MSRFPRWARFAAALLIALALPSPALAQLPPILRLERSGLPAADAPPCGVGRRSTPGMIERESTCPGGTIDACGRLHVAPGAELSALVPSALDATGSVRIDSMMVYATIFGYAESYSPGGQFRLCAHAESYYLDNGTSWQSGAGSFYVSYATFDHVETSGDTLRYVLAPPADGVLYRQTDFDSGDHSAQGEIAVDGPLVIVALAGATDGLLLGRGRITSNDATWYGEPKFNYYKAPVGSIVPFRMRYHLTAGVFGPGLFASNFGYTGTGAVDFAHAVHPPLVSLEIKGPARIPDQGSTTYHAIATYDGGTLIDVSDAATWSVTPTGTATISAGVLTVGTISGSQAMTLHASYAEAGVQAQDDAGIVARHDFFASDLTAWPMYQADSRHTGYLPVTPNVSRFQLLWQRNLGLPLNPVAGGDGKVFATGVTYFAGTSPLYALDAATGVTLWSYNFGSVFSVNPPSYAYGNVYVQSGNHATDTWLHAFDGTTGAHVFRAHHEAQWERYFAPTIADGKVYLDGGYYGGMYAFDALTGSELWFRGLPQYDQWTPALDGDYAYAYVGEYSPGLYALNRSDGQQVFEIPDPQFQWDGWSMNLAPVVGNHDDVLAIHNSRLISFDTANRRIRWQLMSAYTGQPSVANDIIYAIDGGALVALNEVTGAKLWSWAPPFGALEKTVIVTASLAFVSSASQVYAVSLDGHASVWAAAAGGHMAIANGMLYSASATGYLSAWDIGIGPPLVAHAGRDTVLECTAAAGGTHAKLDGTGSEGPDLSFEWTAAGVTFDDAHSSTPTGTFPTGVNQVVLTVSRDGNIDRDTVVVTVLDTTPPSLGLAFEPAMLWPPDHKLVHVHVAAAPTDLCDSAPTIKLVSVTSNEPDGGAGDPFPVDILDAAYGQPDVDVWLRAQRDPGGSGRVYTLCYEVRDAAGHAAEQCGSVVVPQGLGRARLEAGTPLRLTIFGGPEMAIRSVDPADIAVSTWDSDVWRATPGSGVEADVDQDGRTDRTFQLEPAPGATGSGAGVALYARWRAGNTGYYATVAGDGVTAVDADPRELKVGVSANPAHERAILAFALPASGRVLLTVHDVAGRMVAKVVDGEFEAGRHEATFTPRGIASSTLYFYRFDWEGHRTSGRFILLK